MSLDYSRLAMFAYTKGKKIGSGALSGKMMLVRIVENRNIDAYFRRG